MTRYPVFSASLQQKRRIEPRARWLVRPLILLTALVLWAKWSCADPWQHTVTSGISAEYETNPTMSPASQGGIWRTLLDPGYTLARTEGADELSAGVALQLARSSNTALSQNREDPSIFFDWRRRGGAGVLGLSARYDEASTRVTETGAAGTVLADGTRATRTLSASLAIPLSERSSLSLDGGYTGVAYNRGAYTDYASRSGGLKLTYGWSEGADAFLSLSATDQAPAGGRSSSQRTSAAFGVDLRISERLSCAMQAGKSKGREDNSSSSQYSASVQYAGQLDRLAMSANRQTSPSGLGSFVTADQISGDWNRELGERSRAGISLGWRKNRTVTDEVPRTVDAWLQHDLAASWAARAHFQRRTRKIGGTVASSNLLGFSLVYTRSNF